MNDDFNNSSLEPNNIKSLEYAQDVLDGFKKMKETSSSEALSTKLWKIYTDNLPADKLANIYNNSALNGPAFSEQADRLCTAVIIQNLADLCRDMRLFVVQCENDDLSELYNHREMQDLETYLYMAEKSVLETYEKDGKELFFDMDLIIETTCKRFENAPLIGGPQQKPKEYLH